ncbi:MAG TPA: RNA polymerase sigma factor [Methylomirabilota bacterium]|nr:RNA polymerase sigma factor [Methylomirabilota bacterium]
MELLERFTAGDQEAFEALFRQYQGEVYRWAAQIVRNRAAAEDLTIETFWRAYRAHARFDSRKGQFAAWLRRIATNAALDFLRRTRREVPLPEDLPETGRSGCSVEQRELQRTLQASLQQVPPKLRVVVVLGLVEEEPYEEIAAALGISVGAVKVRMFRGVRALRKELEKAGVRP